MNLKSYRIEIKKTQAEAAKDLGVTKQYYGRVEGGYPAGRKLGLKIEEWSSGKVTLSEVCISRVG